MRAVSSRVVRSPAACFGKMPTHGDFVRYNASEPAILAFDGWIRQGLYEAQRDHPRALEAVYDDVPPIRFLFAIAGEPHALIGVLKLSRDRSGRRYPIFVAVQVSGAVLRARAFPQVAARYASFFEDGSDFVMAAAAGRIGHYDLVDRLRRFDASIAEDSDAPDALDRYLSETTFRTFAECVWGAFEDSRKYLLFKNLLDVLRPAASARPPRASLERGLRFPLCRDGVPPGCDLGFWMQAVLRLVGSASVHANPSYFWSMPNAHFAPSLLFHLCSPVASTFADLLPLGSTGGSNGHGLNGNGRTSDGVAELETFGRERAAEAALAIPARYGSVLEAGDSSLLRVLQSL